MTHDISENQSRQVRVEGGDLHFFEPGPARRAACPAGFNAAAPGVACTMTAAELSQNRVESVFDIARMVWWRATFAARRQRPIPVPQQRQSSPWTTRPIGRRRALTAAAGARHLAISEECKYMAITLNINGKSHTLDVPPEMPLLWALRDVVGLTG